MPPSSSLPEAPATSLPTPSLESTQLRMSYRIARGEMGVLTFEPYKSHILPMWRFKTPEIARESSRILWEQFIKYGEQGDFVGMDMSRKFIQMGMTRAKRYANHQGGRKYEKQTSGDDGPKKELPKSTTHKDKASKEEASQIFREVWENCKKHDRYLMLKEEFQKEQKAWDKEQKDMK